MIDEKEILSSDLFLYLEGSLSCKQLKQKIRQALELWKKESIDRPIFLKDLSHDYRIEQKHIEKILNDFKENNITSLEVEYLSSCLELSDDFIFENEIINEVVILLADSVINLSLDSTKIEIIEGLLNSSVKTTPTRDE